MTKPLLENIDNLIIITENEKLAAFGRIFKYIITAPYELGSGAAEGVIQYIKNLRNFSIKEFFESIFFPGAYKQEYFLKKAETIRAELTNTLKSNHSEIAENSEELYSKIKDVSIDDLINLYKHHTGMNLSSELLSQPRENILSSVAATIASYPVFDSVISKHVKNKFAKDLLFDSFFEGYDKQLFNNSNNIGTITTDHLVTIYKKFFDFFTSPSLQQSFSDLRAYGRNIGEVLPSHLSSLTGKAAVTGGSYGVGKNIWDKIMAPHYGLDTVSDKLNNFVNNHPNLALGSAAGVGTAALIGAGLGAYNMYKNIKKRNA